MSDGFPFLVLEQTCSDAVSWITEQFKNTGLDVTRTFDLQFDRQANMNCPCPYHGTEQCDCQIVILLVYQSGIEPISIVAHGHERQTWFTLVDNPQQSADPRLESAINRALIPQIQPDRNSQNHCHGS